MTHEYGDPFNDEAIEAAAVRALTLHWAAPAHPLEDHIERAVHEQVCSCAVGIEDRIEGARSGLHEALAREVRERVMTGLRARGQDGAWMDKVDLASADSFPASDPPAWIS